MQVMKSSRWLCGLCWGGALWCVWAPAQEGYRLLSDQVLVNTAAHWRAWEAPFGVRVVHPDGIVEARFLRDDINAALNAGQFSYVSEGDTLGGGVSAAGSNLAEAGLVIDGNPDTYWEPDLERPVEDWWVDIDLGRAVVAQRIVLRFSEGGDPFLKFRVLVSDGRVTFTDLRQREFFRVGLVNTPVKEQREFAFEIEPLRRVPEGMRGAVVQIVRVQALASDGPRGASVEAPTYQALDPEDRGAIDYFRRTSSGRQIRVQQAIYDALPAAEQGQVRHYRRERPQLAEVEIWAAGDNAVRLTRPPPQPGRTSAESRRTRPYTDGLFATFGNMQEYDPLRDENQLVIDLGARYWLDRIRLLSPAEPPPAYQLRISDGSINPEGQLIWRAFDERLNREGFLQVEEVFASRQVRYIDLRRLELPAGTLERGQVSEIQGYGEGYAPQVVMVSPLIQLQRSGLFADLTWEGEAPRNTFIEARTRSGDEILYIPHYFTNRGSEISRTTWERRSEDRRGPVVIEELPGPDWSDWSEIYLESGESFKSPAPRRWALIEVRLRSNEALRAPRIQALRLRFEPPLADQAFAELWPVRQVEPGQEEEFTLYLQPRLGPGNPGFDRVRLQSSSAAPLELVEVRAGSGPPLGLDQVRAEGGEEGALELIFAKPVQEDRLYAIRFRTQVFLGHTQFSAQLLHSALPQRRQAVSPGDATPLVSSQSLVVVADLAVAGLLGQVEVNPPIITPNGDGANDQAAISLTVFAVEGSKQLRVGIFDLAGRRWRDLSVERLHPSGPHRLVWDGRDQQGRLVPPGLYVMRLGLETDAGAAQAVRLVRVVY